MKNGNTMKVQDSFKHGSIANYSNKYFMFVAQYSDYTQKPQITVMLASNKESNLKEKHFTFWK